MSTIHEIFGTIKPRPVYRERGRFRRETEAERRSRYDDTAWAFEQFKNRVINGFVVNDPWTALFGAAQ